MFLDKEKENSVSIFLKCDKELEIERRINRGAFSNEKTHEDVISQFAERNSQYKANIEPHADEYDITLESLKDFSFNVVKDSSELVLDK
ncbi:MAG: hypothetical protein GY793_01040 [Proteobacteria bacterium]|nr:hypothetical protein [Pseudomonadota bacterium]